MKKLSLSALAAVGVLAGITGANAADLGGNCCADLEERIAELEATTARKGNRKVSLTISGWVSQQVLYFDDGVEKNAYVTDIGATLSTNVKFSGSAKISPDLSAGYLLHLESISNDPLGVNQNKSSAGFLSGAKSVAVLQSFWYLKSESLGKVSVGLQSSAADNVAILPDGSGSLVPANYVLFDNNSFILRKGGVQQNRTWGEYATCPAGSLQAGVAADCDGVPNNNVRYDSPTFAGFSASASWGEDDIGAVAARYAGEGGGFKFAAAAAYVQNNDGAAVAVPGPAGAKYRRSSAALQIGAYVQNIPTGLFVYGAYGKDYNDTTGSLGNVGTVNAGKQQKDADSFYIKAGIRQKWSPLGATVLFGEYGENQDKQSTVLQTLGVTGSNLTQYGFGVVQEIDAAAMSIWLVYRNFSMEQTCAAGNAAATCQTAAAGKVQFDDLQIIKLGAMISF